MSRLQGSELPRSTPQTGEWFPVENRNAIGLLPLAQNEARHDSQVRLLLRSFGEDCGDCASAVRIAKQLGLKSGWIGSRKQKPGSIAVPRKSGDDLVPHGHEQ